jgi:hypothetical protein
MERNTKNPSSKINSNREKTMHCLQQIIVVKTKTIVENLLGEVAHFCNPSYLEGRDQKDHSWRPSWAKYIDETPSETNKKTGCGDVCLSFQLHESYNKKAGRL